MTVFDDPDGKISRSVVVNTHSKTISFCGLDYGRWGHVIWLRTQLALIEMNATALWGSEEEYKRKRLAMNTDPDPKFEFKLLSINGGKKEGKDGDQT